MSSTNKKKQNYKMLKSSINTLFANTDLKQKITSLAETMTIIARKTFQLCKFNMLINSNKTSQEQQDMLTIFNDIKRKIFDMLDVNINDLRVEEKKNNYSSRKNKKKKK